MILDERTEFCDATSIAASAGTALVGDVMDLTTARDLGNGQVIYLVVQVTTAVASGGSATVNIQLASDAAAAIATDGSATVHWQTGAEAKTVFTAGKTYVVPLPWEDPAYERFLGVIVTTATATTTAGAINAFLTLDPSGWSAQADATN